MISASLMRAIIDEWDFWTLTITALVLLVLVVLAALYLIFEHAKKKRQREIELVWIGGYCHVCGYDIRVHSGRCPECGTQSPFPYTKRIEDDTKRLTARLDGRKQKSPARGGA